MLERMNIHLPRTRCRRISRRGANFVSSLINGLMQSPSWKDSAFILTYDEYGGLYDHVPPQPTVSPDGIKPVDMHPGDVCTTSTGPICDFTYTGYRVPLIVVSPFTKKNYVSHTIADSTAILKLIETRFNVPALTKRDAAQIGHDGVLRFRESAMDDAAQPADAKHQWRVLYDTPTVALRAQVAVQQGN